MRHGLIAAVLLALSFVEGLAASGAARAQEGWDKLSHNARVEVKFRNGNTVVGHVALPALAMRLDRKTALLVPAIEKPGDFKYADERSLTIYLTLEFPSLGKNAYATFSRSDVKSIRTLTPLTPEEMERIQTAIKREHERIERVEAERQDAEKKRSADAAAMADEVEKARAELEKSGAGEGQAAEIQAALDFYAKFPPPDWGPQTLEEIVRKASLRLAVTLEEREFQTGFLQWMKADSYLKEQKKKAEEEQKKKEEEEKKKEGQP